MPQTPRRVRSLHTHSEDREWARRACRFTEDLDRPSRGRPLPLSRGVGRPDGNPVRLPIEVQLIASSGNGDGTYTIIALDLSNDTEFSVVLGMEFVDYIHENHVGRNPSDHSMPHVPLFAHYSCVIDLDAGTLVRGNWLGNSRAQSGFERAKLHLGE